MNCFTSPKHLFSNKKNSFHAYKLLKNQLRHVHSDNIDTDKENTTSDKTCQNHPSKKAKYFIYDREPIYYCSKCSIDKATQGHKLLDLNDRVRSEPSPLIKNISLKCGIKQEKKAKLEKFKGNINDLINNLNNKSPNNIIQQVDQMVTSIIQQLVKIKMNWIQDLEKRMSIQSIRIKEIEQQIVKMQQDIVTNESNIIDNMAIQPFNEIMQIYQEKIKSFGEQLGQYPDATLQQLTSEIITDFQKKVLHKQVYVSFQNFEAFEMQPKQNGKYQDLLTRVNHRQSQTEKLLKSFARSESPHFN